MHLWRCFLLQSFPCFITAINRPLYIMSKIVQGRSLLKFPTDSILKNSKIPNEQAEIVKSEDRQDHDQQNETKDKHRTLMTTLKT